MQKRLIGIVVALGLTAGCGGQATSRSTAASPSASQTPGPYAGASAQVEVAAGPRGVAVTGGSVWVASTIGNLLQRVDPTSNQVVATVELQRPVTLVVLDDELWVSVLNANPESDDELVRIDLATNAVAERISIPVFHNIAASAGSLWAADSRGELRRVDGTTGEVTEVGSMGGVSIGLAASEEAVFGIREDGMAWRLPVAGGAPMTSPLDVEVPGRSRVAVGPGADASVWVAVPRTVLALDPEDLSVRASLSLPGMELVNDLWVDDTDVWLSANVIDPALGLDGGSILRLDRATAEVRATFRLGPESSGVVVADGTLWAVDQADGVLARWVLPGD
jgi:streptogramin lyase